MITDHNNLRQARYQMFNALYVVFGAFNDVDNLESYISKRMRQPQSENEIHTIEIQAFVKRILSSERPSEPEIATVESIPDNANIKSKLQRSIDCWLKEIESLFPLADGENVELDGVTVTFLTKDWLYYGSGTPLVKQVTNMAIIYFLRPDLKVEDGQLKNIASTDITVSSDIINSSMLAAARYSGDINWDAGLKNIVNGLAKVTPPPYKYGVMLLLSVWLSSDKVNWNEVYGHVREIVTQELDKQTINGTFRELKGIIDFFSTEYKHLREDPKTTKETLQTKLQPYDNKLFINIISLFQDDGYAKASLGNFLQAATTHLVLFQELAIQDPNHQSDPNNSPYAKTLADKARSYADHVDKVIQTIIEERLNQVSNLYIHERCRTIQRDLVCNYSFHFKDVKTNYESSSICTSGSEKELEKKRGEAQKVLEDYKNSLRVKVEKELDENAGNIARKWRDLANNPVPKK